MAIVGIGVRFPDAENLAEFRANLRSGRDSVGAMPAARAAATGLDPAARFLPMGHLADITGFDYAFFNFSRREASLMDPQQRLALLLAHEAVEDAGYATSALAEHPVAVVLSSATSSYHAAATDPGALSALGNVPFGLPARIAHVLGLAGPCYAVDSGCNGSLIAVHQASRELTSGDAEYAIAGGVSVRSGGLPARDTEGLDELVSPTGRCRAFDAEADGTVSGEGGAVLLLTTVRRALADGAPIHAVIRGSATLHNGRAAATISTPSAAGQAKVIAKAWRSAGADPASAGYVEAHGSGTRLGDAVELEGLTAAFAGRRKQPGRSRAARLPIGSVKTNIGHLDHAAGIAGLIKAVLSVRHGELYPSLHFARATGGIDLAVAGLEVVTGTRPWEEPGEGRHRLAGVSSFSLGGINAHCVVQQPPERPDQHPGRVENGPSAPALVAVSARSRTALARLCGSLGTTLRDGGQRFEDVAFTLNNGRTHHEHRIAVRARDTEELAVQLAAQATWLAAQAPLGGETARGIARPAVPAVVLLLSPDGPPVGVEPMALPGELFCPMPEHAVLAGQLAAHAALLRYGVRIGAVLSGGVSRYVARYLRGEFTERDGRELAAGEGAAPVDAGRLIEAADRLLSDGPVVFVEPSPDGRLGALLAERLAGRENAEVITASERTGGLLGVLGTLCERGVNLNWWAVSRPDAGPAGTAADRPPRRVRLPGHPMNGTRCWVDVDPVRKRPGEPLAPAVAQAVRSVPDVPLSGAAAPDAPAAPPTRTERAPEPGAQPADPTTWLRMVLAELLSSETEIAPHADYFALGGNSIIALQLVERVEARYGFRPKLMDVYDHPTVADFAGLLRSPQAPAAAGPPTGTLPPVAPQSGLVMSFGQERMWFHHQLDEDTTLYNLPMVSHVRGLIDVAAVRGMWEDLAARHEVLRSNFAEIDGAPTLRIRPALGDFFRYADVSGAPDPLAAARELVREAAEHRFDLANDPLVRVLVVRMAPDEHVFQITMHHAVNDGGSPKIFQRELPELYAARRDGRSPRLDPLPVQYRDYARWQRDLLESAALDGELEYWTKVLSGAPQLMLPTDHPRPARKNFAGDLHAFTVPARVMHDLRQLAVRESVTVFVVLLAALYLLLARYSGQCDLVVGTPTTGRNRPELQGLIGFFNSTVALRADLSGDPVLRDFLRDVRTVVLEALEHQEIPFDRVVNALGRERDLSRAPLFDVFYVHQELPQVQQMDGASVGYFDERHSAVNLFGGMPAGTAKFDLTLVTSDRDGDEEMDACLEFSTELFSAGTAAELTDAYAGLLCRLAAADAGDRPLSQLLLPDAEAAPATVPVPAPPPELEIPADRPRPPAGSPIALSDAVSEPLDAELAARLAAFAARCGGGGDDADTCLQVALLAGWVVLLAWVCGQDEVNLGTPAGTVRVELSDEPEFGPLVGRVRNALSAAEPPLPTGSPGLRVRCDGLRPPGEAAFPEGDAGAEMTLSWRPGEGGGPTLALAFAPELFDTATAAALAADLRLLLGGLLDEPDLPVHEVAIQYIDQDTTEASVTSTRTARTT
ncbi:condensation domain-containing protein [Streptomyces sp. NPDC048637]|uniref:condensation domain-containing protein n=1 Tax=Streptomyces sp. NPDC048637 TaxID=3155636 RepID=UPI00341426D4